MSEEQDLLLKISQVSGQINLHKNNSAPTAADRHPPPWTAHRSSTRGMRRGRGGRVNPPQHRNRTLILNNTSSTVTTVDSSKPEADRGASAAETRTSDSLGATNWIAKHDRHRQLINASVYEKEISLRAHDLEESRKLKARRRDEREKSQISRHLKRLATQSRDSMTPTSIAAAPAKDFEININGHSFKVTAGGSRLVKVTDGTKPAHATPKKAIVGGITFVRSKNGNLYRLGMVKARKGAAFVKKSTELCVTFTSTGLCSKGPHCPFVHDSNKVAICRDYLQKGSCPSGDSCDLSHEATAERVPACLHFLRGKCSNVHCRYAHVRVNPAAPVCRAFARLGYCSKGAGCAERHVHECPDYANTGTCHNKKCRMPHVDRAGQLRKSVAATNQANDKGRQASEGADDESDISSEEDDHDMIDSDDVDSDGLEEDLTEITTTAEGEDLANQQDYIHI
ncbi:MAG: hypothetical protein M1825_002337 [Sarcosagium campestre]|nr:MAG: hypothetical protein M1825_002337 [Sarcosagium campestre]